MIRIALLFLLTALSIRFHQITAQTVAVPLAHGQVNFRIPAHEGDLLAPLALVPRFSGRQMAWMLTDGTLDYLRLQSLQGLGVHMLGYLPVHAYLVSIPASVRGEDLKRLGILALAAVDPHDRVSGDLLPSMEPIPPGRERLAVTLRFPSELPAEAVGHFLTGHGFPVHHVFAEGSTAELIVATHRLAGLASLPVVQYLELTGPPGKPEDTYGRAMHRSNLLLSPSTGLSLDGADVRVLVRDDGRIGPHIDFTGRLDQSWCQGTPESGSHGDMVSGILCGGGNLWPFVTGMAPGASLFTEDYQANFLGQTPLLIEAEGITITNSSYSDGCNEGYTGRSETVDRQIFDHPELMHVFSAGNAGTSDCGYGAGPFWGNITGGHKAGKNSLATANLFNDYTLVNSSSRGPVYDGRIKPDIAANGQNQLSTFPDHTIDLGGGTSAAAPGIAGILAQLTQGFRQDHTGEAPASALLKGALLTTASDLGQPGPDFIYGWGHVHAERAYRLLQDNRFTSVDLDPGETDSLTIVLPAGLAEVRFMIYWADQPALPQASKALVNDFELRVKDPQGKLQLPLVLDPTPDPALLNLPAKPGADHLNNMEQVRIPDPVEGSYTLAIKGLDLPLGPARVWVLWDTFTDDSQLVFPSGGESMEPASAGRIYWEAVRDTGPWDLDISLDSAQTWAALATGLDPSARFLDITWPDTVADHVFIRLRRDGVASSQSRSVHLLAPPSNLHVVRACPDSLTLEWSPAVGAREYTLFTLGSRYMTPVLQTDTTLIKIPVVNPLADHWYSLTSQRGPDLMSDRSRAFNYHLGLLGCKQAHDLKPEKLLSPSVTQVQSCEPVTLNLILSIRNDGLLPEADIPVWYTFGNGQPVADTVNGVINPGGSKLFKFGQPLSFDQTGDLLLKVWTAPGQDDFRFNDTLEVRFDVRILNTSSILPDQTESFDAKVLPENWTIENPDGEAGWLVVGYPTGADSNFVVVMPNFFNPETGQTDILTSAIVDLTGTNAPVLGFDLSYSGIVGLGLDTLLIEVSTDCGASADAVVWEKTGPALITIPDADTVDYAWIPGQPDHWRTESVPLDSWAGQKVRIRFRNQSGYGNNLFLDQIRFTDSSPTPLQAGLSLSADTLCPGESLVVSDGSLGAVTGRSWTFGEGASPGTATGIGPHSVTYPDPGWKTILLVVTDGTVADSAYRMVYVQPLPEALIFWTVSGDTLFLTSQSIHADSLSWTVNSQSAGSGANVWVIPGQNQVSVTLTAANACGEASTDAEIDLTPILTPDDPWSVSLAPNPTDRLATLTGTGAGGILDAEILDPIGRVIWQCRQPSTGEHWTIPLDLGSQPAGAYLLRLWQDGHYRTFRIQKL